MIGLLITVTPARGLAVGLALIAVGMLLQYWLQLEVDCWRDRREQAAEAEENRAPGLAPRIPEQRTGGSWIAPRGGPGKAEGGAR